MRHFDRGPGSAEMPCDTEPFPVARLLVSCAALAACCYLVLVDIPEQIASGAVPLAESGLTARVQGLAMKLASMPVLTFVLCAGLLVPGFFRPERARQYYLTLTVATLLTSAVFFVLAGEPARRLGESVNEILSMERELPETLPSKKKPR